jgi:ABC-2 type transport system permease protein
MVTSVSHGKLIGGKIVGIIGVGFTQLAAWLGMVILVILIGRLQFAWIRDVNIDLDMVVLLLAVLLPACVMIAALMAAIGSVVTEPREGQQLTGLVTMPLVLPFWFILQIMNNPNGPISIALSFFPLTSPVALTLRAAFTVIPLWQMLLNVLIMVLFAGLAVWFAGRAFRLGMLQYGRRLSFRELIRRSG